MQAVLASLCFLLLPFIFCVSLLDIALRSIHYDRISSIHRHGSKEAQRLLGLLTSPEQAISVLLFFRYTLTVCLFLIFGALVSLLGMGWPYKALLAAGGILFGLVQLEYIPRMIAVQNPERIAFTFLKPFELILKINRLLPLPQIMERLTSRFLRLYGFSGRKIFSEYSVNEIKMFLSLSHKADTDLRRQTIDSNFMDFSGRHIREVMVPRPFVKSVDINTPLPNLVNIIQENAYSRMPVYRSNFDNILGILHVKDILGAIEPFSLESVLHKPYFIPESATVQSAFQNMRRMRAHLAIVVDEYGGVDGIVTLEDLIEELLGEIHDEYDEDVELLHKVTEGTWLIEGNLPIKELNESLNLNIPEDASYTTVAGFLLSVFDRIPTEKDGVQYGNLFFTVEKMLRNKISRVALRIPQFKDRTPS